MIRKLALALGATAVLGAAALSPTAASAAPGWHGHGHHGHGYHRWHGRGFGFYGPTFIAGGYCYTVKRVVETPYGPRLRRIQVCD
ncbi:MAG: hypothetical protein EXQ82_10935 [Pseudolabrys sp.]|nr:hypothetical protein [Pseudolabrys sp.]